MREHLRDVFETKSWAGRRGRAPRSGPGSSLPSTQRLRAALPQVFADYKVKRFLDAPCGDWFWMQHVDLSGVEYIGADISHELIESHTAQFTRPGVEFRILDVTSDPLPKVDMMMCRECLFHLKYWLRWAFFENFVASEIPYLMMSIDHIAQNKRLGANGGYGPFNPMVEPFNFAEPLLFIPETMDEVPSDPLPTTRQEAHRSMAIWSREQVREALARRAEQSA